MSEEALQIAVTRREVKGKGGKERYTHLNAEFKEEQGEIRKPSSVISAKKERKIIEWERLVISSRRLEIIKGTFHAKMGSIKARNGRDLTKQKILRRGGKNTRKNYIKKFFTTQIIMMV